MVRLDELNGLAYPRKLVEQIILSLSDPLNLHLVKLAGFDFPPETRRHFQGEIGTWMKKIQILRFKPSYRTGSFKFYYDLLFDYPFGGVELRNIQMIIDQIIDEYPYARPTRTPEQIVEWLRHFHTELAERLHNGEDVLDLIPA
jgi:hypothetical protein